MGNLWKELRYDLGISWHTPLDTLLWRVERKEEFVGWILSIICLSLFRVYLFRQLLGKTEPPRIQLGWIWVLELLTLHNHHNKHAGGHAETQLLPCGRPRWLTVLEDE